MTEKTARRTIFPKDYIPFEQWVYEVNFGKAFTKPKKALAQDASEEDIKRKIILEAQDRFNNNIN